MLLREKLTLVTLERSWVVPTQEKEAPEGP